MKKMVLLATGLIFCLGMHAQSMKMVVSNDGEVQGRYVRTNADT